MNEKLPLWYDVILFVILAYFLYKINAIEILFGR